jgi:sulfatase-like protein
MSPEGPPNIAIIVLDTVRGLDYPDRAGSLWPTARALAPESVVFSRAVSPSPWTIPSHASLFTGLYPWQHGVHRRGRLILPRELPTIAEALSGAGYATFSGSANGMISPSFGLTRGFETAAWGDWWEPYLRLMGEVEPTCGYGQLGTRGHLKSGYLARVDQGGGLLLRAPALLDRLSRIGSSIRRGEGSFSPVVSSWIEPTFERWLRQVPSQRPIFAVFNFMEPHEPYFVNHPPRISGQDRRAYRSARMDQLAYLEGSWRPDVTELEFLHRLYVDAVELADRRVATLIQQLKDARRWQNCLLVLTSDHGQAFGEDGFLFHALRLPDAVIRVPMLVRLPGGREGGALAEGWASLVDVAPTIAQEAGIAFPASSHAMPLTQLIHRPREHPVFSAGDGISPWTRNTWARAPHLIDRWDRVLIARCESNEKTVLDSAQGLISRFSTETPSSQSAIWRPMIEAESPESIRQLTSIARSMTDRPTYPLPRSLESRLRSWGY